MNVVNKISFMSATVICIIEQYTGVIVHPTELEGI